MSNQVGAELTERALATLRVTVGGTQRADAVAYMPAAVPAFARMPREAVGRIVLEIVRRWDHGLAINDPALRYTLQGLQLLRYLHVGT